ncbi:hypothetical protein PO909_000329 [Leuciscus waleckii]
MSEKMVGKVLSRLLKSDGKKIKECAKEWLKTSDTTELFIVNKHIALLDKPVSDVPTNYGFHPACYRRFIDKKRLTCALKRQDNTERLKRLVTPVEGSETVSPKRLRSKYSLMTTTSSKPSTSQHVLPKLCIICKMLDRFITINRKRQLDKLVQSETENAGLLREAAEMKSDESILTHIRGKDCIAIEVRYHKSCYRDYTRFLSKTQRDRARYSTVLQYPRGYKAFCKTVIEDRLIEKQEILRVTRLVQLFCKAIKEEGYDIRSYRSDLLKRFLQRDYPQLLFHKPVRRNLSEMVFCEGLSATDFMEPMSTSSTETERDSDSAEEIGKLSRDTAPYTPHEVYSSDRKSTLFSAGIIVQQVMQAISGMTMPWPPLSTDLNIDAADTMVPVELYNLIAWCTGASDEPVFDKKVQLPEDTNRRLLSICQDIVYLASSGKKPTPKSLALGLTVRHLTGSSQLLDILSRLGHCISTSSTIGFETALAEYQLATGTDIPKCMSKQHPTVLVWDNIDFGEETLSGRGTTHHTNGIMVQSKMKSEDHRRTVFIRKGVRTLQPQKSVLDLYIHTKRQGAQELNVPLLEYDTVPSMELAQKTDTIYVLLKYSCHAVSDTSLPGWTGYNCSTQTCSLPKSALYYLPVVEASPTEMTTVNTILTRSVEIADRLELESIVTVYDQAIYAKAQQIRWKDQNLMQRFIPRLGEFHTAMSFMAVIGKRFKEAGLQDMLIESNVVAVGSINGVISGHHYNRSIRAHKLLFEAMHILRLRSFLQSLPEQQHTSLRQDFHLTQCLTYYQIYCPAMIDMYMR